MGLFFAKLHSSHLASNLYSCMEFFHLDEGLIFAFFEFIFRCIIAIYFVATAQENNIDSSSYIFFLLNSEHLISQIHLELFESLSKFRLSCIYNQHTVEGY